MINLGDKVEKVGGDYTFIGFVVAKFNKLTILPSGIAVQNETGPVRFVVQDDWGILHIYSEKNLRKI